MEKTMVFSASFWTPTSLGSKVDKLKDQFHELDKTQSQIRDELVDLKKNGDLRQNDIDIPKKQHESKIAI